MAEEIDWNLLLFVRTTDVVTKVVRKDEQLRMRAEIEESGFASVGRGSLLEPATDPNADVVEAEEKELPEDEARAVRRVVIAAHAHQMHVHVVDVGKESVLRRVIDEHRHKLSKYPVLVRKDGQRLEGLENLTNERLQEFIAT